MEDFEEFAKKVQKFDVNKILFNVWKPFKVRDYIIMLNTQGVPTSQLYQQGIDSKGVSLGEYSPYTIQMKLNGMGDTRVDHITLKDTGGFYESFEIKVNSKGFKIIANPITDNGHSLSDDFGKEIIGLSEENIQLLVEFITPYFIKEAEKIIS